MSSSKPKWPSLTVARGDGNGPRQNLHDRVLDLHHDTSVFLSHLEAHHQGIPKPLIELIKNTQFVVGEVLKHPLGEDWRQAVTELREITLDMKKNTTTTQHGPLPRLTQSPPTALVAAPERTPSELSKDREVIVKLPDPGAVQTFRRPRAVEIKNRAEKARVKASRVSLAATLASVQFVAARQLKSGDLSLSLRTAQEAEIARCHPDWVTAFHQKAIVRRPTWGVVVHDVQVKSIGDLSDPQESKRVGDQLLAENCFTWGDTAKIVHLTWLTNRPANKKSSALVIEFSTPQAANKAINEGTIWDSTILTTVLYDRSARIRRCFKCQQYGHIGSICSNPTTCGLCAGSHETRDCPQRSSTDQGPRKCANCGDAHAAWSKSCKKYAEAVDRVQAASSYRQRYHRIPPYLQDFCQDSESSGSDSTAIQSATPVESSQQSEGSGGPTTAKKTPRPSKGSRKAKSEPPRKQLPRAAPSKTSSQSDLSAADISFAPVRVRNSSSNASASTTSRRLARIVDRLSIANPPNLTDETERPPKALRNDRTAAARGTRLHIYQDDHEEDDSSDELSEPMTTSDWQPSSILQDKDTNTSSSTHARKNKRKRGIENLVQNGLQQMEIDPQIDFAAQNQTPRTLQILQYNVHRSKNVVMAQFLRDPEVLRADIIAIQEPWDNPFQDTTHHPAKATHQLLYPEATETGGRARVCLYVSRKIDPTKWNHTAHSQDCQELELHHDAGTLRLYNIYNPHLDPNTQTDTLDLLEQVLDRQDSSCLLLGDFNLHHPAWGGDHVRHTDRRSDRLLELTDTWLLDLWTEPGAVTRDEQGHRSTIDLTFGSMDLTARLITCEMAPDIHADSDHLPIRMLLDISTPPPQTPKRRNWKAMDAQKLCDFVSANIDPSRWSRNLETPNQIEDATDHLIEIIQQAITCSTPWARPSKWANPDWTPECTEMVKLTRLYRRVYTDTHTDDDWIAYTKVRNRKGKVISQSLQRGHRRRVQQTVGQGPRGMWRIAKWARNREGQAGIIPTLRLGDRVAETAEQKVNLLREAFFPPPPPADLSDIENRMYNPTQDITFPDINEHEIIKAIRRAPPDKAPGPDAIPNKVWHALSTVPAFIQALKTHFNACIHVGHNPQHFQVSTTVVLRKAAPRDFRLPKSYRPIALLNTLGKILESIIALRISWALEEHGLLPKGHLGGRKGVSVDHAIQLIIDTIYRAWGHGQKVSMLLLDISGAFDNVSLQRLVHNLRTMQLGWIANWLQSFLSNRYTRLQLPGFLSELFATLTGIPQGSPLSPILFLIFNTPLIRTLVHRLSGAQTTSIGWIDDSCALAVGQTYAQNVTVLEKCLEKADRWANRHAAKFAPDKFELIHFTNPKEPNTPRNPTPISPIDIWEPGEYEGHDQLPIHHGDTTIQPTESARYLGIWLDKTLSLSTHRTKTLHRANSSLDALRSITGSTWGASLEAMRAIYRGVVIPQLLYGITAWFSPASRLIPAGEQTKIINEFTKIQKRAATLISGAFRGTAAAALDMELHLLPIRLQMQQIIEETAIRIQTGPSFACPQGLKGKLRPTREIQRSGLTPLEALRKRGGPLGPNTPKRLEGWESRKAYVLPPWEPPLHCTIEDHEAALKTHNEVCKNNDRLVIYTDGSGYRGRVGASAVCLQATNCARQIRQNHLGTEADSTVYAAELDGIRMALDTAKESSPRSLTLFTDSQAAIQAVQNPRRPSGQYILQAIYRNVQALGARGLPPENIKIHWIPAHVGVAGNEAADEAAKEAAAQGGEVQLSSAGQPDRPEQLIIRLAAAAKRVVRQRIQQRWKKQWEMEKGAKPTRRLIKAPHKKNLALYKGLSKPHTSIIIQMRTMRIGLRHFLFKIKASETDRCSCGEGSQTPKHILLQCSLYVEARRKMINKLFDEGFRGNISDYDMLVSDPQAIRYVAEFMHQTGLLNQFRHAELTEPAEQDQERGSLLRGSGIDVEDDG
ncbi:hypothetical protein CNMCM5878_004249 [Aspergillus fumigatiaffinis]|nr:hypothetical protein CNMCM5878_004249 [Aspergillus fumigatiaffinis]